MNADYVWKLSKFGRLTSTRLRFDDDFADRLNYQFTGLLLFVFVGIIGIRQYVGKPIQCWTPQEFTRSWEEYAENYCWVASTYFVHLNGYPGPPPPPPPHTFYHRGAGGAAAVGSGPNADGSAPGYLYPMNTRIHGGANPGIYPGVYQARVGERPAAGRLISYYQWAPILLAIQSFLFYLPCLIWRLFASQSGFHLRRIMQLASEAALAAPTEADASAQPQSTEPANPNRNRLSLQNLFNLVHSGGAPATTSFAPTKSVRTLARYLDMCLMRQRELRLAVLLGRLPLNETPIAQTNPMRNPPQSITRFSRNKKPPDAAPGMSTGMGTMNDNSQTLPKLASFGLEGQDDTYKTSFHSPPTEWPKPGHPSMTEHDSLYKPKGTNCLDLICCCGLASWCMRKACHNCCCQCHSGYARSHNTVPRVDRCNGCPCSRHVTPTGSVKLSGLDTMGAKTRVGNSCSQKFFTSVDTKLELDQTWGNLSADESQTCGANNCPNCGCSSQFRGASKVVPQNSCFSVCGRYQGNFLVRLHMFVKLLYLVNTVGQIYLLEYYTGVEYNFYGIRVLYDLARGRQWEESGHFPRVTFCDFEARKLAQSHYYTLQCVLPINMFLEKIYIFLWLWFFLVGLITLISILIWICRIGTRHRRFSWIRHQLITIRQLNKSGHSCMQFVENHLGPDGVFVLRLIAQNYGDLVAGDAVGELWAAYWQRRNGGDRKTIDTTPTQGPQKISDVTPRVVPGAYPVTNTRHARSNRQAAIPTDFAASGDPLTRTPSQRERRRRQKLQSGYSATMMATEMIYPSERFAVPLLTSTRRPPSIPSRGSSRYSQDSRERDRSESPPPIPQRSPEGGDYSLSDHHSVPDYDIQHSESQSTGRAVTPTRVEDHEEAHVQVGDYERDQERQGDEHDREVAEAFDQPVDLHSDGQEYREQYMEDIQQDDNIV